MRLQFVRILLLALPLTAWLFNAPAYSTVDEAKSLFNDGKYRAAFDFFSQHPNEPVSAYYLGIMKFQGRGTKQDIEGGIDEIRRAANLGEPKAQLYLGYLYETGSGVTQDYSRSIKWYREAVSNNNIRAMYNLALAYRQGRGVSRDDVQARQLYEKAGDCYAPALNNLAYMLQNGLGGEKNLNRAVELYTLAANANYAISQYNLAIIHVTGDGADQDFVKAYKWLALAAQNGHKKAAERREVLLKILEPVDIKKASEAVLTYKSKPLPSC